MAFIRKKRKGNTYYYELVESKRTGKSVEQKALEYFPTLADAEAYAKKHNLGMPSNEKEWIDRPLCKKLDERLNKLNSLRPLSPAVLERLREKFEIDMTYHSNAIEGNRLSLRETWLVLNKGITVRGKSVKEHLEATNHREAIDLLEKFADSKKEITEKDVLDLHALILDKIDPSNAGFYRHESVFIHGSKLQLPKWKEVPMLMKKVYAELNSKDKGIKAIYSAVSIHHDVARIHPFVDGNGRLARLLMNLRLMRAGFPPTILRKEERRAYYSALEKADGGDFRALAMIIGKDIRKALDLYIEAAE
ncbi:MAG: Fic family protein [Candidatus Micrarchaeota archaeon]|nr:Fic family protein [Candidatus Micrarchaeota archaeon]